MKIEAAENLHEALGISKEQLDKDIEKLNEEIKEDIKKNTPVDENKLKVEF